MPNPPRWLSVRVALAGLFAAGLLVMLGGGDVFAAWRAATCQTVGADFFTRCWRSGIVLLVALATAASAGFTIIWLAQFGGARVAAVVVVFGRVISLFPVAALAWSFVGWWIGALGWPVETLMPFQLTAGVQDWRMALGSKMWEYFAPALVLAVPLLGEVVASAGMPLRARLQAICLYAPAWLIIVEDVLHFMGWGGWMAQEIRAGQVQGVAAGLAASAWFTAVLCVLARSIPTRKRQEKSRFISICWLPWPLWAIGALSLPVNSSVSWALLWLALLVTGAAGWYRAWKPLPFDWQLQVRWFASWSFEVVAGMLLWGAAACSLKPALAHRLGDSIAQLCRPLAISSLEATAQSLADPALLFRAGGLIMLASLFFNLTSRILRPCPPSPSSTSAI